MLWTIVTMLDGISIHIYDLLALPQNSPQLHKFFMDEYFIFHKTDRKFLVMGIDQVHEQNKALMKDMSWATSSLNKFDESSFTRWGLYIHQLASIAVDTDLKRMMWIVCKRHNVTKKTQ